MELSLKTIALQYQGYLNTPLLWKDNQVFGLEQLQIPQHKITEFKELIPDNLRLGKRVEQFVLNELEQSQNIDILLQNRQVQNGKITIGEIDCILKQNGVPIHLEIVYKFYLYDPSVGNNEIEHWIGPNRNDTLLKKLTKLKEKQLPLIYNTHAKPVLEHLDLHTDTLMQRVLFKAQLFTPYKKNVDFDLLNQDCLNGFYMYQSEMQQISDCEFFIPTKVDWLQEVRHKVDWIQFHEFKEIVKPMIQEKRAPLCWIKFPDGKLQKMFVVWW